MDFRVAGYDEGLTLYGSLRVFHGQIPYRDFWTMYPPAQFYLLAAAFHLGVFALWERIFYVLFNAVSAVTIVLLLENLTGRRWLSRVTAVVILIWLSSCASYGFPIYPALTFILLATLFMQQRWRGGSARWPILAGIAIGSAALFRHDLALYALVALCLASLVSYVREPKAEWSRAQKADVLRLILAAGVIVVPVLLWLLIRVPANDLYYGLIYVPGFIYPKVRSLPFPRPSQVIQGFLHPWTIVSGVQSLFVGDAARNIVWFPLLAVCVAAFWLVLRLRKRDLESWKLTTYAALLLLTSLLFLKGFVRVSPLHMVPAVVPAFALVAALLAQYRTLSSATRAGLIATILWATLCLLVSVHLDYDIFRENLRHLNRSNGGNSFAQACHPPQGLERAKCLFLEPTHAAAMLYVQSRTSPDERIFIGVPHFDVLFDNDIAFYFFSEREAGTGWYDLHPGVETTAPIQRQMISDLKRNHVRYIIEPDLAFPVEPNASGVSSGVNLLTDYIHQNYALQKKIALIEIFQKKD